MMLHFYGQAYVTGLADRTKQMKEELLSMKHEILGSNLDSKKMMKFKLFYTAPKIYAFLYRIKEG